MRCSRRAVLAIGLLLAPSRHAFGQAVWTYDHSANCPKSLPGKPRPHGCTVQKTIDVKPGDHFTIVIVNTEISQFTYEIQGFAVAVVPKPTTRIKQPGSLPTDTVELEATHDSRYGGYVVTIATKAGDSNDTQLAPATLVIMTPQGKKPYAFSGGISMTNVRNPGFVVRREFDSTMIGGATKVDTVNRIREDRDRRDAGTVGFATFATVNLPNVRKVRLDWLNLAIGIGLETNGETQYYFGGGAELHDGIFLNAGYVLGRINMLPSGLRIGDVVTDANALANLSRRSTGGFFVGLSFTFLGGGQETYGKPFAGSQQ